MKNNIKRIQNSHKRLAPLSLNIQINKMSQIRFLNHKTLFTFQKYSIIWHNAIWIYQPVLIRFFFLISRSTSPDKDIKLNQNLSIIIISHIKIILMKHFYIQKNIEVEMRWQISKPSNIFLPFYLFRFNSFFHTHTHTHTHIYIYNWPSV